MKPSGYSGYFGEVIQTTIQVVAAEKAPQERPVIYLSDGTALMWSEPSIGFAPPQKKEKGNE